MSVALANPASLLLPRQHHPEHPHQTDANKPFVNPVVPSPSHPHAHGYLRRRLASPISPLSMTYKCRSIPTTKEEVMAICDREVQWNLEREYGRTIANHMSEAEVRFSISRLTLGTMYALS
jgi:hypothetical protein